MSTAETLATALVAAQSEMPKVPKNGTNPHFHNQYVTLDDLLDAVRPVLNRHGLAVVQMPSMTAEGQPALSTTILHVSGERIEYQMPLVLQKQDMQGVGAAITYARRYMLAAALGIAEGVDDDGNQASQRNSNSEPAPKVLANPAQVKAAGTKLVKLVEAGAFADGEGTVLELDQMVAAIARQYNVQAPPEDPDPKKRVAALLAQLTGGSGGQISDLITRLGQKEREQEAAEVPA